MKGMGRFSKDLEASEGLAAVMDLEKRLRVLQGEESVASSAGFSHGMISSKHSSNACSSIFPPSSSPAPVQI